MKVVTWKELLKEEGTVVWSYLDSVQSGDAKAYILYKCDYSLIEEDYPILTPEDEDCFDFMSTMDKFIETGVGTVSRLETTGDILSREKDDKKVVIYEKRDLLIWKDKLEELLNEL